MIDDDDDDNCIVLFLCAWREGILLCRLLQFVIGLPPVRTPAGYFPLLFFKRICVFGFVLRGNSLLALRITTVTANSSQDIAA